MCCLYQVFGICVLPFSVTMMTLKWADLRHYLLIKRLAKYPNTPAIVSFLHPFLLLPTATPVSVLTNGYGVQSRPRQSAGMESLGL